MANLSSQTPYPVYTPGGFSTPQNTGKNIIVLKLKSRLCKMLESQETVHIYITDINFHVAGAVNKV